MDKILNILLKMKKARLKHARGYVFNTAMQIESVLIQSEIEVLEKEIEEEK